MKTSPQTYSAHLKLLLAKKEQMVRINHNLGFANFDSGAIKNTIRSFLENSTLPSEDSVS